MGRLSSLESTSAPSADRKATSNESAADAEAQGSWSSVRRTLLPCALAVAGAALQLLCWSCAYGFNWQQLRQNEFQQRYDPGSSLMDLAALALFQLGWMLGALCVCRVRTRGFRLGGTAGRTTLAGEGLQHQDGHSHAMAANVPNCRAWDPAYAYELALILHDGMRRMVVEQEDVFYYVTVMNENYIHPAIPAGEGVKEGIIKGCYKLSAAPEGSTAQVNLLGSGTILNGVVKAQALLQEKYDIATDVYSVTSYKCLTDDALECDRWNLLHPEEDAKVPYVQSLFEG